jgi:hypothetical protein
MSIAIRKLLPRFEVIWAEFGIKTCNTKGGYLREILLKNEF